MNERRDNDAARLRLVGDAPEQSAQHAVFEAMIDGWRAQRLSRNLAFSTVESGARTVRRFRDETGAYPWCWQPADLERFMAGLRADDGLAHSTVRNYGLAIGGFLVYVCDGAYGWDQLCLERFGSHRVQICHREMSTRRVETPET